MAKDGAALLIGLGRPKGEPAGGSMSGEDEEESGSESAEEEALSDFFSLGKSGDLTGAKDALKTFLSLCYPELGSGSDYSEGSGEEEP